MSEFLSAILAGLIAQGLRALLQKLGLFEEFKQLVVAFFILFSGAAFSITLYLGLKALLLQYGIEIHWMTWLFPWD